ncbi:MULTISPECIES: aminoglycoside adenylyltransferase family protein [unclassified Herbaspirillum]|uniref:aminoglycoside adenylyltransferase family protein n=1 Tax=unclassified Herbaspirillum TaxID=2624150 RepID=UPI00115096BE|nr:MULTISPECIES: aminoglycoside adenylyltransferase family protein [unclassified Herbaspirillum]MBB5393431.1 streptomycin 3'-adenylyltransferase [Herbaspirillum sp. SJZ102]TQK03821.1 streptomycin 3'-adenylyltransferase [Herbaspirillum sp. SJZ130]TQK08553.1 streptomycin 3'-adenylyltransferase [Herbaspirillum sp. SJZ106]
MTDIIPLSIAPQVAQAQAIIERHLGGHVVAIHLFGSAVDGGLRPYSDIDLLVTVAEPPGEEVRRALMTELLTASAAPGSSTSLRALEVTVLALGQIVPWRYPPRRELQFGEWLREDILAGVFEEPALDHDLAILLTKARASSIAIVGSSAGDVFNAVPRADLVRALLDTVAQWNAPADWEGEERNIILALARIWYTATTGEIAAKDFSATWLLERIEPRHRAVLANARAGYLGEAPDNLAEHAPEVEAFIAGAQLEIRRLCSNADRWQTVS